MIQPFILGTGRAGHAIFNSLQVLQTTDKELEVQAPRFLERGAKLLPDSKNTSILFIANPHGLHAPSILQASEAGFQGIGAEKPSCISLDQADSLKNVKTKTAVFHGYRQMWGPQTIKKMIDDGDLGEIISVEGRYWQSSTADRAIHSSSRKTGWKDDPKLGGTSDVLLDIGTHWADMAIYFMGDIPREITGWSSYKNAESPNRDTHIHMSLEFSKDRRALGSISKTVHGATNHFEIHVLGTKKAVRWTFLRPDELLFGEGKNTYIHTRTESKYGSLYPPFHALGWMEGYIEITRQLLRDVKGMSSEPYPTLRDNIALISLLLRSGILKK
jgi:predicted dehydrogenase